MDIFCLIILLFSLGVIMDAYRNKKVFLNDYDHFKKAMIVAAGRGELPFMLRLFEVKDFTPDDFQDLFSDFCLETSLELTGFFFTRRKLRQITHESGSRSAETGCSTDSAVRVR